MEYFYPVYLSSISILFYLCQAEVLFEFLIIEVRIQDVSRRSKEFHSKH